MPDSPPATGQPNRIAPMRRAQLAGIMWVALVALYAIGFWGPVGAEGSARPLLLPELVLIVLAALAPPALGLICLRLHDAARALERRAAIAAPAAGQPDAMAAVTAAAGDLAAIRERLDALARAPAAGAPEAALEALARAVIETREGLEALAARLDALGPGMDGLRAQIEAMRAQIASPGPPGSRPAGEPGAEPGPAAAAPVGRAPGDGGPARPARRDGAARARPPQGPGSRAPGTEGAAEGQPPLPLPGTPAPAPGPLDWGRVIQALNFPRDAGDSEGFRALHHARADHQIGECLQSAEDVLTLLSQDGIYMDDLAPDPVPAEAWVAFAGGARGGAVQALGAIGDQAVLEAVRQRIRSDAIFRDSTLHFLRRFEPVLRRIIAEAGDDALNALAETRTARAFMLVARAHGAFD
ncbi:MAG: hypothetical protein KatS3mg118_1469 [Paracoccaceae bacterium]|nr:MAG: hypothetical protein KatS3mg118_1469 [Paracoccaceae bacterium]